MRESIYFKLIAKKLSGEISPTEEKRLEKWMISSTDNRNLYEKTVAFCKQVKTINPPHIPDSEVEWSRLQQEIYLRTDKTNKKEVLSKRRSSSVFFQRRKFRYGPVLAVSTALILFIGFTLWRIYLSDSRFEKLTTRNGQKTELTFADGTHIRLNSGSTLKYPKSFSNGIRQINLSGEAFFNVKKDKRPFIVITDNAKTTVLGTQFNIWARFGKTRIMVRQGTVRFEPLELESEAVQLDKGTKSEISGDNPPMKPKSTGTEHPGWLKGILVFKQTPLLEIIGELERHFGVNIKLKTSDNGVHTLTGSFVDMSIDTVLSSICMTFNLKVEKKTRQYMLYK